MNHDDPMTDLAMKHGCSTCGDKTDVFYWIEYFILPTRLVRKRHRDKRRAVIFCRRCYEEAPILRVNVGGDEFGLPKNKKKNMSQHKCIVCGGEIHGGAQALYGVVSSLLLMDGSGIESIPLGMTCSECAEELTVEL